MKNLIFIPTLKDYREYIYRTIVTQSVFHTHSFYKGLIEYIIDIRTPLFFEASHDYERSHFTQYFNWSLIRHEYDNPYIGDLYFLHDFVHMAFRNPLRPRALSFNAFCNLAISNEYVAANETEIMTYYRIPELRKKTFTQPILYDKLVNWSPDMPSVQALFGMRKAIIENTFVETLFLNDEESWSIIAFLKKFNKNNQVWCRLWYNQFPEIRKTRIQRTRILPYEGYSSVLNAYMSTATEDSYRRNVLYNCRILAEMLDREDLPETFSDCERFMKSVNGEVVMKEGAKTFYERFVMSKEEEKS